MGGMSSPESLDPLGRFSDRVGDYVRYRPSYPAAAIAFLGSRIGLSGASTVADVGSGTGIFTGLLLATGAHVLAVEPNDAMRSAAEVQFAGRRNFTSVRGAAEATGLADRSVSLVTCAQAFHWFDVAAARREFSRILSPGGWCALVWNTSVIGKSEFAVGYERIKEEFGTDFRTIRLEAFEREGRFDAFFGPGKWEKETFANFQSLDLAGLRGRLLSSSYAPKAGQPGHEGMMTALDQLFERCQKDGAVRMDYDTEVFFGRLG